ncbi:LLM class flavin-dependent oxidoreductase [Gordonia desulfuricans]|uniref:LLM class flavin-dependent oxidoreductase n=1 Tax=Gordonia desulfuricans TaxID=89051 RepID=A0A7K3LXA1_9ACTN|nr:MULTISPECIES: LLM class flavin-dependent oxidoreductase [Gordonia]NDK92561.1 LLM class flavin-dependent oxidoreductase [Gordonia desulfuricans]WLP92375.1 LLM class flavin-dependent oxidoreductase [Gordonia sp. NB41Y]
MGIELGLDTFGDVSVDDDGAPGTAAQSIRNLLDEAILADEVGVDFIGVGEHHRDDYSVSAPEVVLGAIAGRTSRIRLGSAVTVLSSDDPIRVFERFSTVDALSSGRAEVILGRGSFTESFPLFGFDLEEYEELFSDKLSLFAQLRTGRPVSWEGVTRPPLTGQVVYPQLAAPPLPTWIAVGGSPESVVRAARHGLPLMLAIIGGDPLRFAPYVDLYRRALNQLGKPEDLPVGVHSPGHVAETDEQARDELWPHYRGYVARIGAERGWPAPTRIEFDRSTGPGGSLYVGSPETVAQKIAHTARALGLARFDMKYSHGTLGHRAMMRSIELYGTQVIPRVRELLAEPE